MKLKNLYLDLKGNPCDYANSRNTVNINKVGLDMSNSKHDVASVYQDQFGGIKTELRSVPMPGLARSKQTMQYTYNANLNISNIIDEDGNRMPKGDRMSILHDNAEAPMPMVEESHHLSIVDNIPFQSRKHFTIRKHYQDLYNRESKVKFS